MPPGPARAGRTPFFGGFASPSRASDLSRTGSLRRLSLGPWPSVQRELILKFASATPMESIEYESGESAGSPAAALATGNHAVQTDTEQSCPSTTTVHGMCPCTSQPFSLVGEDQGIGTCFGLVARSCARAVGTPTMHPTQSTCRRCAAASDTSFVTIHQNADVSPPIHHDTLRTHRVTGGVSIHQPVDVSSDVYSYTAIQLYSRDTSEMMYPHPSVGASTSKSLTASTALIMMGLPFAAGAA